MLFRMKMNKKGEEAPWNFGGLAIAGIVIIGLVIVLFTVIPRMQEGGNVASTCRGTCSNEIDGNPDPSRCPQGWELTPGAECGKEYSCCLSSANIA